MRTPRSLVIGMACAALAGAGLAGCDSEKKSDRAGDGRITVTATDTECKVGRNQVPAGTVTFAVTNKGAKVTEFYLYAEGDRVMGEVENIAPGLSRELIVEVPAGSYETACKPGMSGKGIRAGFTAAGSHQPLTGDAKLADATRNYQAYVRTQATVLAERTADFVAAVKANDVEKAKSLYPVARSYYERIEPVAEIFGELDPAIDGREDGLEAGQELTGFHRLEKDLWEVKDISRDAPIADKLLDDVKKIVAAANRAELSPVQLANGAKELLDEVATGKITGEEERYSHTDLWDFQANLEGSQAAIAALRPAVQERDPALIKTLDERFAAAITALAKYRVGDGYRYHNELTPDQLKELGDVINALSEPVSKVAAVVATR
jgi:iron uptake system component EfeO